MKKIMRIMMFPSVKLIKHKTDIRNKLLQNKYSNKYLTDIGFKTEVGLCGSAIINFLFIMTNIVSGFVYHTAWFFIFAGYYGIMGALRFLLIRYMSKNTIGSNLLGELKRARTCSFLLLLVNLMLTGIVLMMIFFNRGFRYQGFLIYIMAIYAFYALTSAIVDMVRYRKYKSPVMTMGKITKMTSALFSMLFLETAMLSQFGGETAANIKRTMIMLTGACISIIVFFLGIYMIIKTTKHILTLQKA